MGMTYMSKPITEESERFKYIWEELDMKFVKKMYENDFFYIGGEFELLYMGISSTPPAKKWRWVEPIITLLTNFLT